MVVTKIIDQDILSFEFKSKGNTKGLTWNISEMMIAKFKQKASVNPSFLRVFNPSNNMTKSFKKEVKFRTMGERNLILEIMGVTGSGKSLLAVTLGVNWMSKKLLVEDICFTNDLLLKRAPLVDKSHLLIQDEQIYAVGVGSQREQYERQTLEDTTRKFGLSMIFCSPTIQGHTTAHYGLEIICINKKERLTKVAILNGNLYLGYFVIKVLPESNKLWKEYNKAKDEFITSVLGRSNQRLSIDDMSESLLKHPLYKHCKTSSDLSIICLKMYPTLTNQENNLIVNNLKMLKRVKKFENLEKSVI